MNKYLISAIFLLVVMIVSTIFFRQSQQTVVDVTPVVFNVNTPAEDGTLSIPTGSGYVKIANVKALPGAVDVGSSMYHFDGNPSNPKAGFGLLYSEVDNSFSIAIDSKPIKENRESASLYFLELLNISKEDACSLKVFVGVTASVDTNLAGKNIGLSFCPGAVAL